MNKHPEEVVSYELDIETLGTSRDEYPVGVVWMTAINVCLLNFIVVL